MQPVERVVNSQNSLGEGPLWHPGEGALYWVDIALGWVERFHPASGQRATFQLEQPVTSLGRRAAGGFIVSTYKGLATWDGKSSQVEGCQQLEMDLPDNRFNDGKVDPAGRYWAGTMNAGPQAGQAEDGSLYCWQPGSPVQVKERGVMISNGLGWSPDHKTMYYTDSPRQMIYAYEYDETSGQIANRRAWVHDPDVPGVPDGLAVDSQGFVWSARWGGWRVTRYDSRGKVERVIAMPVEHPTSCALGGPDLQDLYITSAWIELNEKQRQAQPYAGDLFRLRVETPGLLDGIVSG